MTTRPPLVFDFGAVLFRWQPLELVASVLTQRGDAFESHSLQQCVNAIFESHRPNADWTRFDLGLVDTEQLVKDIATRTGLSAELISAVIQRVPQHLSPIGDMVHLLHELNDRGHRMYYLSNMPKPMAQHLIQTHAWIKLFECGVFSCDAGLAKPEAQIFQHAHAQFGLNGPACFIDDALANVQAAQQHGWQTIHHQSPATTRQQLTEAGYL